MPELSRRRSPDDRHDCWHIFYDGVHVGTIAPRIGIAPDQPPWGWQCGFYPGCHPGEHSNGSADSFDQARERFEAAWRVCLANRTPADFQEWREQQAWTERKYAMWARGERMPTQTPSSRMTCPCGEGFDSHRLEDNLAHVPHNTASELMKRNNDGRLHAL